LTRLQHYPDPQYHDLRQALGAHHGVDAAWILPGNGAAELLTWAARDLCQPEEAARDISPMIGLLTPAFSDYERAIQAFGGNILSLPLVCEALLTGALDLARPLLSLIDRATGFLINTPHNPTGAIVPAADLLPLLETGKTLVVDEAFMDFVPGSATASLIPWVGRFPNLVIVRSLTKFYSLPGLRMGYVIAHPDRLRRWQQWRDPWPVNTLAQAATLAALQDQAFQAQTLAWLPPTRQALLERLQSIVGLHPLAGAANFLLVQSDYAVPPLQAQLLKQHQILIRDCLSFPELGERYFRIAVRTEQENRLLLEALEQTLAARPGPTQASRP
jgi:histidinol-phosphate/aromatic aminotransferase/cobyric acid decarboxylase-like protein